ncbi:hypothetical protein F7725_012519 [Dissostichus mawsoni]|uniref:SSD domain-containing protein n=1 Tax=Dissostichus mawsoni TaxID=36200 RepID=A0A7J5YQS1_DISMA|nr:hypothetical protein F7725_012519 [Dissostichus mawsoni]
MQHPQFHQFCWKPLEMLRDLPLGPSYCSPPSSLLSYLYPSERGGKIYYDGMGPDLADIQGESNLTDFNEIHFGAPLPSFYSLQDRAHEQRSRFKNFVVQYADILAKQSTSQVKVLYGGTELFDDEVRHTFHNDMMLAVISGACITVLVYVLTSFSGVDDVFVFISTFRQASHLRQPQQRMIYTIKTAGRATFLTSFTTAAAYAANTFSQIPAVHDFGLFMALIVSCCWLWVSALMPAALWKLFSGLSASHSPLSDEDDDVALLSVEMEPGSCDTDGDASILSLSVETSPFAPGQQHVGVVHIKVGPRLLCNLYRFSLNTSTPSPWKLCSTEHEQVSSFQAYNQPRGNYTRRMTVCVSHVYHPYPSWMITSTSCEPRHGWSPEFSFYVRRLCSRAADSSSAAKMKSSKTFGFNPCSGGACGRPAVRPLVDTGAMVFVVFGILGVNRTEHRDNHVIGDMGSIILDPDFDVFQEMEHLCKICKAISANTQLVKPGGAQCLPSGNKLSSVLPLLHPECLSLPQPNLLPGQLSHGAVGLHGGKVRWLSMAFESTTYKGKSSFQTYSDFLQWENFIQEQLASLPQSSALQRGVICLVVAIMYWLGWEMGAVEAISLSILVGSSVDYCLHLVEGYLLAGETMTSTPVSSAVTTVISTVPLFFCVIVPFAKFGQIVAINTAVSILFTLTVTVAMLAWVAPPRFNRNPRAVLKASLAVMVVSALGVFICWVGAVWSAGLATNQHINKHPSTNSH